MEERSAYPLAAKLFQGSIFLGDGFLLTHDEADRLNYADPRNAEVIFPVINGQEINNEPDQKPGRAIINFHDWCLDCAATYPAPIEIVDRLVKPERLANKRIAHLPWWLYERARIEIYRTIRPLLRCFVAARTTKYLSFSAAPTNNVFTDALYVLTTDRWDLYAVVQSTLHEVWARKYSGALKQDLRYSPSKCFDPFAFPEGLWRTADLTLATIGERYHEQRREIMLSLWLGLTDVYNLFHARDLEERVAGIFRKRQANSRWLADVPPRYREFVESSTPGWATNVIQTLRVLHRDLDNAVLAAYGWTDSLSLNHDFVEVETLAENDRVRLTIAPAARTELLRRLLALNHARAAVTPPATSPKRTRKTKGAGAAGDLFG